MDTKNRLPAWGGGCFLVGVLGLVEIAVELDALVAQGGDLLAHEEAAEIVCGLADGEILPDLEAQPPVVIDQMAVLFGICGEQVDILTAHQLPDLLDEGLDEGPEHSPADALAAHAHGLPLLDGGGVDAEMDQLHTGHGLLGADDVLTLHTDLLVVPLPLFLVALVARIEFQEFLLGELAVHLPLFHDLHGPFGGLQTVGGIQQGLGIFHGRAQLFLVEGDDDLAAFQGEEQQRLARFAGLLDEVVGDLVLPVVAPAVFQGLGQTAVSGVDELIDDFPVFGIRADPLADQRIQVGALFVRDPVAVHGWFPQSFSLGPV